MFKLGIYSNRQGEKFEVIGTVRHGQTKEVLVLYRSLDEKRDLFVAPEKMFEEVSEINGLEIPRWFYLDEQEP